MELFMPNYQIDYPQMQDVSGLTPVFQNIGAQQAFHNQQLQQQNQQSQDALNIGQSYGKGMSGMNPLAMAAMLRQGGGASVMDKAANYFGTQQTPEMQSQINQLGSNTWNPMSDYNTGANGWGSFGE
jgi:UDP-N-acetylglucosamine enolpyruvyl transferase